MQIYPSWANYNSYNFSTGGKCDEIAFQSGVTEPIAYLTHGRVAPPQTVTGWWVILYPGSEAVQSRSESSYPMYSHGITHHEHFECSHTVLQSSLFLTTDHVYLRHYAVHHRDRLVL